MAPTCSRERSSNDLSIPPKLSGHTPPTAPNKHFIVCISSLFFFT